MRKFSILVACLACYCFLGVSALATDWQGPKDPWYEKQVPTPETLKAYDILWQSCCDTGDVCQDCVVHHVSAKPPWTEGWYYTKDGVTKPLPSHIVEYVPWTPTGKPVLFIAPYSSGKLEKGEPVCLKVPGGSS